MTMKVIEAQNWASSYLKKYNRDEVNSPILLSHHLDVAPYQYYASMHDPVPEDILEKFKKDIIAHSTTGIPIQHLMGFEYFYDRKFVVNKDVLIPRVETEEVVFAVENYLKNKNNTLATPTKVVDLGTGSGVIATTLKLEFPEFDVYASDLSEKALAVAKDNAKTLGADVTFVQGDFLQPFIENKQTFQLIISNPPYIAHEERDSLQDTVKDFDPELALFADDNGLAAYKKIIKQSTEVVDNHALIAFEVGYQQGIAVKELIEATYPNSKVKIDKDINKKDRMVLAEIWR